MSDHIIEADDAVFAACLQRADQRLVSEEAGYFGPDSVAWQVFREPCILLGGYRAIMLQMAHPAVAQGVELSSSFRNDVVGRARRTIQAMNGLIFGSKEEAVKAATIVHKIHHQVTGVTPDGIDSPWAGQQFRANHLDLKNWVGLSTVDTVIDYFEKFVRPFSTAEREQLAIEVQTLALLCGLPEEYHRESLESLQKLRDEILVSGDLAVGEVARGIVGDLFGVVPGSLDERITYGMLPQPIREMYQISWTEDDQENHDKMVKRISFLNRSLPKAVRYIPAWYQAQTRIAKAKGEDVSFMGGRFAHREKRKDRSVGLYMQVFGMNTDSADQPES